MRQLLTFQNPWILILIIMVFLGTLYCAGQAMKCDDGGEENEL
jgi:hypothetical protein